MARSSILLSTAIEEYLQISRHKRGNRSGTVRADVMVLRCFLRHTGDKQAINLKAEHVETWFYGTGGLKDVHKVNSQRSKTKTTCRRSRTGPTTTTAPG